VPMCKGPSAYPYEQRSDCLRRWGRAHVGVPSVSLALKPFFLRTKLVPLKTVDDNASATPMYRSSTPPTVATSGSPPVALSSNVPLIAASMVACGAHQAGFPAGRA